MLLPCAVTAAEATPGADNANSPTNATEAPSISFEEVRATVERQLKHLDLLPDDLISRSDVDEIFAVLRQKGWLPSDARRIRAKVLEDRAFLVRQFSSTNGKKFMRQISRYPESYDRVDRLTRLPHGRRTVLDLIRGPDGYKLIKEMTTTHGGFELGVMVSRIPQGTDFNGPTGRIYTGGQLITRLRESYQKESRQEITVSP
jgi:hypothetical protein